MKTCKPMIGLRSIPGDLGADQWKNFCSDLPLAPIGVSSTNTLPGGNLCVCFTARTGKSTSPWSLHEARAQRQ